MLAHAFGVGPRHVNRVAVGVNPRVVHGRGHGSRRGDEALDLLGPPALAPKPQSQSPHVIVRAAGERAHQIRDEVLLFPGATGLALKYRHEFEERLERGLAHETKDVVAYVLRSNFELAAGEARDQGFEVPRFP